MAGRPRTTSQLHLTSAEAADHPSVSEYAAEERSETQVIKPNVSMTLTPASNRSVGTAQTDLLDAEGENQSVDAKERKAPIIISPDSLFVASLLTPQTASTRGLPRFVPHLASTMSREDFDNIILEVRLAIEQGVLPTRISKGSSGSYFARDRIGTIVGVFKPKNEEPYGKLNPKWTKWLHKNLFPCCFGRSCLIPNLGYISEAVASLVDRKLGLHIVPRTEIVSLSSSSFYYGPIDRANAKKKGLPPKIGSFQLFLRGFKDASHYLRKFQEGPVSPNILREFQRQFERLVILDYVIRNTDRGMDNWMISFEEFVEKPESSMSSSQENIDQDSDWIDVQRPRLYIAGIDHGLALPFKHPDNWRSYPYAWAFLPAARVPFSAATCEELLPILSSPTTWEELVVELRGVCGLDDDFDESLFRRQVAVMRGQIFNLIEALGKRLRPMDLVMMPPVAVFERGDGGGFTREQPREPCFEWW